MSARPPVSRPRAAGWSIVAVGALALTACSGSGSSTGATDAPSSTPPAAVTTEPASSAVATTGTALPSSPTTDASGPSGRGGPAADSIPAVAQLLDAAQPLWRFSVGRDRLGVWICHVGLDIKDPIYNATDFRLDLDPDGVATLLNRYVTPYFQSISHGAYTPQFVDGGDVDISGTQTNRDCVSEALDLAPDDIDGVIVVADAEHGSSQPGGWGRPGNICKISGPCPANVSGRATYIGASDFHPDWGAVPAVDLEEHEIGHSLGFPHSGDPEGHDSALDLMSNSASPRDTDPDRRDGPDTLGVNRLAAGWLPLASVIVGQDGDQVTLVPSSGPSGPRLLVLPLPGQASAFITVEVLADSGFDDHLPEAGIAIHRIDQSSTTCRSSANTTPCLNELRRQEPLHASAPYTDLLQPGGVWSGEGWTVKVLSAHDGSWTVGLGFDGSKQ